MLTINDLVKEAEKYLAHIPKKGVTNSNETLEQHSKLVLNYTEILVAQFDLKPLIRKLIIGSFKIKLHDEIIHKVSQLFLDSIYYHDLGKINPNFQRNKMKNSALISEQLEFGSDHSLPGYMLFVQNKVHEAYLINDEAAFEIYMVFIFLFGYQIAKHHAPFLEDVPSYFNRKFDENDNKIHNYINDVRKLFSELKFNEHSQNGLDSFFEVHSVLRGCLEDNSEKIFSLFALLKLHYSLLTASDYLATTHYMNNWEEPLRDFGCINEELRSRIILNVRTSKNYNKKVFELLEGYQFSYPTEPTNENLNILRRELSIEVIQNIRKNTDKNLFYIEAPTGGGKTNLSMLAAAELLEQHPEISNIYYVFPFTTLITQTYDALKETMGLSEDEIIQLHSKEGFKEKEGGEYGQDKKNHIDYLFLNYPVALLSHVKFFEILKTNGKESNYLLHRLANSIVVVDELQSYPPKIWDKLMFLIQNYAHYFNIRFILMSATLPKLDKLSNVAKNICYLTNNKEAIFQNPSFSKRVDFDFSLLDWKIPEKEEKEGFLYKLGHEVVVKSKDYADSNTKYPNSVFTIIEFIYKKTASDFYLVIKELANGFFDKTFVLSGTILESRRKEIIHYLKDPENRDKKVILITTQVVEAGVDIDMDLGFKDKSIVDSDEQLAGRINRNVNKPACKLYLFNCDNAEVLYKGDERFRLLERDMAGLDREILQSKDFDKLYDVVMSKIDKQNKRTFQQNFTDFSLAMQRLNFQEVNNGFKIINQQSTSVFVPMEIDVYVPGTNKEKRNFTEKEMELLESYQVIESSATHISGEKVFELYEHLIKQENDDFIEAKTELKKLQGIMSQFIFSLMTRSISMEKLVLGTHGEESLGMFYLSHWKEDGVYDYKFGLIEKGEAAIIL